MKVCAASMAAYLHYMADVDEWAAAELARTETQRLLAQLQVGRQKLAAAQVRYLQEVHAVSMGQLRRSVNG